MNALAELLGQVGAARDGMIFVGDRELREWPQSAVAVLKAAGLLTAAEPASSVVCPGCERQCTMPVHKMFAAERGADVFVVCDKRSDTNRVPVSIEGLERWMGSGEAIAALLARLLKLQRRAGASSQPRRWEVGTFKGQTRSGHLVLTADDGLKLVLACHTFALEDVLSFKGKDLILSRQKLIECVDDPVGGGGDRESASRRQARLEKRRSELQADGQTAYNKIIAAEEGLKTDTIKKILARGKAPKPRSTRGHH